MILLNFNKVLLQKAILINIINKLFNFVIFFKDILGKY